MNRDSLAQRAYDRLPHAQRLDYNDEARRGAHPAPANLRYGRMFSPQERNNATNLNTHNLNVMNEYNERYRDFERQQLSQMPEQRILQYLANGGEEALQELRALYAMTGADIPYNVLMRYPGLSNTIFGVGLKKNLIKGSLEAKAHMKRLRDMRKCKKISQPNV